MNSKKLSLMLAFALMSAPAAYAEGEAVYKDVTGIELGAGGHAIDKGAISTGKNSLAIGNKAIAAGDNLTREDINAELVKNEEELKKIEGLKEQIPPLEEEFNNKQSIYTLVKLADQKIKKNNEQLEVLTPKQTAATEEYEKFAPTYNQKVKDMNDRLNMIKTLNFKILETDREKNLNELATQLKERVEEGHSFSLDHSFYKEYIENYLKVISDLKVPSSKTYTAYIDSDKKGYKATYKTGQGVSNKKTIYNDSDVTLEDMSFSGDDIFSPYYSEGNDSIKFSKFSQFEKGKTKPELNKEDYEEETRVLKFNYDKTFEALTNTKDIFISDTLRKQTIDYLKVKEQWELKHAELRYTLWQHNNSSGETKKKLKNKLGIITSEIENLKKKMGDGVDLREERKKAIDAYYEKHVKKPGEANNKTKAKLEGEFKKELAEVQAKMDKLQSEKKKLDKKIADLNAENKKLEPTKEERAEANKADAAYKALEKKRAELAKALDKLKNNNLANRGEDTIAIGRETLASGDRAIAIGATAESTANNAVALGYGAKATLENNVALGSLSTDKAVKTVKVGSFLNENAAATDVPANEVIGVVSIGTEGKTRQLVNLAAGEVSKTSTDAINGSQFYHLVEDVKTVNNSAVKYNEDKSIIVFEGKNGTKLTNLADGEVTATSTDAVTGRQLFGLKTTLENVNNSSVKYDTDKKDKITLEGKDGTVIANLKDGKIGKDSKDAVTGKQLDKVYTDISNVLGKDNVTYDPEKGVFNYTLKLGDKVYNSVTPVINKLYTSTERANEGFTIGTSKGKTQVKPKETVKFTTDKNLVVTSTKDGVKWALADHVTVDRLTIRKAGNAPTDAANVGSVHKIVNSYLNTVVNNQFEQVKNTAAANNARLSALSALSPLDFDEDHKTTITAGLGYDGGKTAVALGLYKYLDEDCLINVAGSYCDDLSVRFGLSWRLGRYGGPKTKTKAVDTKTARENLMLKRQIVELAARVDALEHKDQ